MTENSMDQSAILLNLVLETLDKWRHLPSYKLEPRVDVFFGLLLPDILKAKFELQSSRMSVIPEFPLRKGTLNPSCKPKEANESFKVDFAVFYQDSDDQRFFLVELKTDNQSIKQAQLERMKVAKGLGAEKLLDGVIRCARRGEHVRRKYAHLMRRLDRLCCIENLEGINNKDWKRRQPGLAGRFRDMGVGKSWSDATIELVLIYPGGKPSIDSSQTNIDGVNELDWLRTIDFYEFAGILGEHPLAPYLRRWADCEAGGENPWDNCARS